MFRSMHGSPAQWLLPQSMCCWMYRAKRTWLSGMKVIWPMAIKVDLNKVMLSSFQRYLIDFHSVDSNEMLWNICTGNIGLRRTTISSTTLALSHIDNNKTYGRMLFIKYSSSFHTLIPNKLILKLLVLGFWDSTSNWIVDFLTWRLHLELVGIGHNIPSILTLNTGASQGCVRNLLLYSLWC